MLINIWKPIGIIEGDNSSDIIACKHFKRALQHSLRQNICWLLLFPVSKAVFQHDFVILQVDFAFSLEKKSGRTIKRGSVSECVNKTLIQLSYRRCGTQVCKRAVTHAHEVKNHHLLIVFSFFCRRARQLWQFCD